MTFKHKPMELDRAVTILRNNLAQDTPFDTCEQLYHLRNKLTCNKDDMKVFDEYMASIANNMGWDEGDNRRLLLCGKYDHTSRMVGEALGTHWWDLEQEPHITELEFHVYPDGSGSVTMERSAYHFLTQNDHIDDFKEQETNLLQLWVTLFSGSKDNAVDAFFSLDASEFRGWLWDSVVDVHPAFGFGAMKPDVEQVGDGVWRSRLSMPGYLDCTDWSEYETEEEAWDGLCDLYGDYTEDRTAPDDTEYEVSWELYEFCRDLYRELANEDHFYSAMWSGWQDHGRVFSTLVGGYNHESNLNRDFRMHFAKGLGSLDEWIVIMNGTTPYVFEGDFDYLMSANDGGLYIDLDDSRSWWRSGLWYHDSDRKEDLESLPFTNDETERGKGKVYVDEDGNGYCPDTGYMFKGSLR